MQKHEPPSALQVIYFQMQNTRACIDLHYINQAILLMWLDPLPNSEPYVTGLMNMHGESIMVIDLAMYLGLIRVTPYSLDTPILLCKNQQRQLGMIVDNICGLATIDASKKQMSADFSKKHTAYEAVVNLDAGTALLLNIERIFADQVGHYE